MRKLSQVLYDVDWLNNVQGNPRLLVASFVNNAVTITVEIVRVVTGDD